MPSQSTYTTAPQRPIPNGVKTSLARLASDQESESADYSGRMTMAPVYAPYIALPREQRSYWGNINDDSFTFEGLLSVIAAGFGAAAGSAAAVEATPAETAGAFDAGGSAGVFGSGGEPLYTSPIAEDTAAADFASSRAAGYGGAGDYASNIPGESVSATTTAAASVPSGLQSGLEKAASTLVSAAVQKKIAQIVAGNRAPSALDDRAAMNDAEPTGAFDRAGSRGVFDSSGNPLYRSPQSPLSTASMVTIGIFVAVIFAVLLFRR